MTALDLLDACDRVEKSGHKHISIPVDGKEPLLPMLYGVLGEVVRLRQEGRTLNLVRFNVSRLRTGICSRKLAA